MQLLSNTLFSKSKSFQGGYLILLITLFTSSCLKNPLSQKVKNNFNAETSKDVQTIKFNTVQITDSDSANDLFHSNIQFDKTGGIFLTSFATGSSFKSTDGGENFSKLLDQEGNSLYPIYFNTDGNLLSMDKNGSYHISFDKGLSYQPYTSNLIEAFDFIMGSTRQGLLYGYSDHNYYFQSGDGKEILKLEDYLDENQLQEYRSFYYHSISNGKSFAFHTKINLNMQPIGGMVFIFNKDGSLHSKKNLPNVKNDKDAFHEIHVSDSGIIYLINSWGYSVSSDMGETFKYVRLLPTPTEDVKEYSFLSYNVFATDKFDNIFFVIHDNTNEDLDWYATNPKLGVIKTGTSKPYYYDNLFPSDGSVITLGVQPYNNKLVIVERSNTYISK